MGLQTGGQAQFEDTTYLVIGDSGVENSGVEVREEATVKEELRQSQVEHPV